MDETRAEKDEGAVEKTDIIRPQAAIARTFFFTKLPNTMRIISVDHCCCGLKRTANIIVKIYGKSVQSAC